MGKIRYVCTACRNGFTTRAAAKRHVEKIEHGKGMVVSEASYRAGLATGIYFPSLPGKPPRYERSASPVSKTPSLEVEEFNRGFWRRAGELSCDDAFKDETKRAIPTASIQLLMMENMRKITKQDSE